MLLPPVAVPRPTVRGLLPLRPFSTTLPALKPLRGRHKAPPPPPTPFVRIQGGFKSFKPITPGVRHRRLCLRTHLWGGSPIRKLTLAKRSTGGRGYNGRIVCRHRGGGHRRRIRLVDFHRREPGTQTVVRLEYDPGRSAHLALLQHNRTGALSYIICPEGLTPGTEVTSFMSPDLTEAHSAVSAEEEELMMGGSALVRVGNCAPLSRIPIGTTVHCIGLRSGGRAQMARAAGTWAQILYTGPKGFAQIRLGSGEVRKVPVEACATIGRVGNGGYRNEKEGKAGVGRWKGRRPTVRGMAMNACDHPHGGGRGKSKGNKDPRSPWGVLAKGGKTRKKPHPMMIKPRPRR